MHVDGLSPAGAAEIVSVDWLSDQQLEVTYRTGKGLDQRILVRDDLDRLFSATATAPFSFNGNAENFRLAAEAHRIALAHLFDPYLALTTANIEALPHQITAVYGEMLERHPLRFLLADDPGAGKTIMAGLFIKELMIRGDLKRCKRTSRRSSTACKFEATWASRNAHGSTKRMPPRMGAQQIR